MEYINNCRLKCQYKNVKNREIAQSGKSSKKNSHNNKQTLTFHRNSTIVVLDRNTR